MTNKCKQIVTKKAEVWLAGQVTPLSLKELGWRLIGFVARCGKSNPLSFALRPVATHRNLRIGIGAALMLLAIVGAIYEPVSSLAGADTGGAWELAVMDSTEVSLETKEAVKKPLASISVSQKFWLLHAGVDLRAPKGTEIRPIMAGKIIAVKNERFGYGKHVIVTHNNGWESLYAHMSVVFVNEGAEVNLDTVLGEVGSTGRSTGPHLHLEVREEGKLVNPASFLGL